jgi:hypothetical protein
LARARAEARARIPPARGAGSALEDGARELGLRGSVNASARVTSSGRSTVIMALNECGHALLTSPPAAAREPAMA